MPSSRRVSSAFSLALLSLVVVACVQGTAPNPNTTGLSIGAPFAGQILAGTVAVVAGGVGGSATDLRFTLGDLAVDAATDGVALFDTRSLDDGDYTLEATAKVGGTNVGASIDVTVRNDLPDSGQVGPDGGTLRSAAGSYATLPAGALTDDATLALTDTSQEQILDEFGVDYPALGVTFLGALTVEASGTSSERSRTPVQVDLAGWAAAVQPNQQVVMFNVLPDADGDGVGELTFASDALATPDGSVITLPTPRAELYGVNEGGSLRRQQSSAARPGEIVELQGRGLSPTAVLGNTAHFAGGAEILVGVSNIEQVAFNPLQRILLAVPALGAGNHGVTLRNGTTGFTSERFTLQIGSLGSGNSAQWDAFLLQVATALEGIATDQAAVLALGNDFLAGIDGDATLHAMVANSGLVSAGNLALLDAIGGDGLSAEQRDLVLRHALLLDALAVSRPAGATSAASLASLMMMAAPGSSEPQADIRTQQGSGGTCGAPSAPVFWGTPTGMGSGPPSSCAGGGGAGPGSGSSPIRSQRLGGDAFGPVEGALVRALVPDSATKLSPFTAVTNDSGAYFLPFLPPEQPVTIQAIDAASGRVAQVTTVTGANRNEPLYLNLIFVDPSGVPGAPRASFTATIDPTETAITYDFDASASTDQDGSIVEYIWDWGDGEDRDDDDPLAQHTYVHAGTFTVTLTVVDDEGKVGSTQLTLPEFEQVSEVVLATGDTSGKRALASLQGPPAISADGRFVVFQANGQDLSDGGIFDGDRSAVYRSDLETGEIVIANLTTAGVFQSVPDTEFGVAVSGDGRLVAFASDNDDLVPGDSNGGWDAFVKDLATGELTLVPVAPGGVQPTTGVAHVGLSDDGTALAVRWGNTDFSIDPIDITVTDLTTGVVTWVTESIPEQIRTPVLSGDGRYVVYGIDDHIYRADIATRTPELVSAAADGSPLTNGADLPAVSHDGRYVAFRSNHEPLCTTVGPCVVRKDMATGEIELVAHSNGFEFYAPIGSVAISGNGRWVVFDAEVQPDPSISRFVRGYVWDAQTDGFQVFDLNQVGAEPDGGVQSLSISSDGSHIAFMSDATNYVNTFDSFPLPQIFRTNNPLWEETP